MSQHLPILIFILVGVAFGGLLISVGSILNYLLGTSRPDEAKLSPYECGFAAFEDARMRFDVRYYLIAILFILFDLEIAFIFPWASVVRDHALSHLGFWSMMVFVVVLLVGFAYEWKKGALDWE
jgi:NADH-quinone oxidoreductase subunit A